MKSIRLLIADDHTLVRRGVRRVLEADSAIEVVAEASSGLEAIALVRQFRPDVALLDIGMTDLNGIEAAATIVREAPETAVIILSMYSEEQYVENALKAGVRGYLLKDTVEDDLFQAVHSVAAGKRFFSPGIVRKLKQAESKNEPVDKFELLTPRERQIYAMLGEGKSNKEIANLLNLSLHTVATHRIRIMDKLELHSAAELVLNAVRRGFVH